jgi:hypothetical protein
VHVTPSERGRSLGSKDARGEFVLILDFSEFFTKAGRFGAILCRLDVNVLNVVFAGRQP